MTALAVLARAPRLGEVKTRLAAGIGHTAALAVYRALLAHTAAVAATWPGPVTVFVAGDPTAIADSPLGGLPRLPQAGGGLGARLAAALSHGLQASSTGAIAIGTDCPGLRRSHLDGLEAALAGHDAAFGPALDGGYWGIGVASPAAIAACCGDDLPWSTPALLGSTVSRLQASGLRHAVAASLADLDDAPDLRAAEAAGFRWQSPNKPASPS